MNIVANYSKDAYKVGDIVYPRARPQCAGVVIQVNIPAPQRSLIRGNNTDDYFISFPSYIIRMANGKEREVGDVALFQSLIDDHKRKLATHETLMAKLKAMP